MSNPPIEYEEISKFAGLINEQERIYINLYNKEFPEQPILRLPSDVIVLLILTLTKDKTHIDRLCDSYSISTEERKYSVGEMPNDSE